MIKSLLVALALLVTPVAAAELPAPPDCIFMEDIPAKLVEMFPDTQKVYSHPIEDKDAAPFWAMAQDYAEVPESMRVKNVVSILKVEITGVKGTMVLLAPIQAPPGSPRQISCLPLGMSEPDYEKLINNIFGTGV